MNHNYAIVTEGDDGTPFLVGPFERGNPVGDFKDIVKRTIGDDVDVQICWGDRILTPMKALAELSDSVPAEALPLRMRQVKAT